MFFHFISIDFYVFIASFSIKHLANLKKDVLLYTKYLNDAQMCRSFFIIGVQ